MANTRNADVVKGGDPVQAQTGPSRDRMQGNKGDIGSAPGRKSDIQSGWDAWGEATGGPAAQKIGQKGSNGSYGNGHGRWAGGKEDF